MTNLPIRWPEDGLIPAVIQEESTQAVLMVGFMNAESLRETFRTGLVHFWSRSRQELWQKGATSGHVQRVRDIRINCELNSLLIEVEQVGAVCHDGYATCYYRRLSADGTLEVTREPMFDPADVYGTSSPADDLPPLREWWDAYAWLRDHDFEAESGTSRLLRSGVSVVDRIKDELRELAGVLDGSHTHTTQHDDVVLEGSQVAYWLVVHAQQQGQQYERVSPDRAFSTEDSEAQAQSVAVVLRSHADRLTDGPLSEPELHELFALVAQAGHAVDVEPMALIRADLAALREKPYLEAYFAR